MHDEPPTGEDRPINRRNLMIVLGGLGAIMLLSSIDGPSFNFWGDDKDRPSFVIGGNDDDIDAKVDRIEAAVEKRLEDSAARLEAAESNARIDEDELDAAIDELRDGNPERFLKTIETL